MLPLPILILVLLSAFFPALSRAEVISASLGTGLKADGSLAEINSTDIRWTVRFGSGSETLPRVSSSGLGGSAIPAGTRGQWIIPQNTDAAGRYTYRSTPYLEFPETSTPRLQLRLAADDAIYSVRVNGQHQLNSTTGFDEVDTVIVEEGLHPGMNELEIIVYNASSGTTGLWCEMMATYTPIGAGESLSAALVEDMLKVSWPARDPAFGLTYKASLDDALDWAPVITQPDLLEGEFSLTFPTEQEKGFYRLAKTEITEPPVTRITVDPTGPAPSQPVYLASNGETGGGISTLGLDLNGAIIHSFNAGDSFDPRTGSLSYDWKIFHPSSINGGAEYTGAGLSGVHTSALQIAVNTLPDIGTNLWRARLTVTSDAGNQPLSRVAEFHFRYAPNLNSTPVVTVVVNPTSDQFEEVRFSSSCHPIDGCTLNNSLPAIDTHVFDASASIDPRGGTLSYAWEFRYPTNVNGGAVYSHPGIVVNGPVVTIAPNSFPDIGGLNYRARLTVTSTLPDGSVLSAPARFRFQYTDSELPF